PGSGFRVPGFRIYVLFVLFVFSKPKTQNPKPKTPNPHMSSQSTINLGLIGCGTIAQLVHLPNIARLPNVKLAALAESDAGQRAVVESRYPGIKSFADYRELLALAEIDAVLICLPTHLHAQATIQALTQGKHVYLEKPLATSLAEGEQVLAAWKQSGLIGMIGYNYRFHPLYQKLKKLLSLGKIGDLVQVRSVFSTSSHPLPAWRQSRQLGGGVLLDLASHHVDLVRYFFEQEIQQVSATVRSIRAEADTATLVMGLENGLTVESFFSQSAVDEDRFELYGRNGKLAVDRYQSFDINFREARLDSHRLKQLKQSRQLIGRTPYILQKLLHPGFEPSYQHALSLFIQAIRRQTSDFPDFSDGFTSLKVIIAAEASAASHQMVPVSEVALPSD
ncbi:MAG TPA: Gfo/Idh/MocA family oxidoreductase, partial [Acidobacteriota bacterium]|nr:Gfo/Idh/MocA family oxidoreductase [Acidobacteriota bacterium]